MLKLLVLKLRSFCCGGGMEELELGVWCMVQSNIEVSIQPVHSLLASGSSTQPHSQWPKLALLSAYSMLITCINSFPVSDIPLMCW